MNSAEIKEAARRLGADLVGIAPVTRFDGMPQSADPRTLVPGTRSVIVVAHRIMRGTLRGVEEGTSFGNTYHCYGFNWSESFFLSKTVYDLCCEIENSGAEATPLLSRKYSGNDFIPDYMAYAHAAGLGSVGKGGFFLTPEYGHRQRFGFIFTNLELEGDEIIECDFCKDCDACIKGCPLNALTAGKGLDLNICRKCRNGAWDSPGGSDDVDRYAAACGRACMVALEDKVGNRFVEKFRKRSVWSRDAYGEPLNNGNLFSGGRCPDKMGGK